MDYNEDSEAWENYYANEVEPLMEGVIGTLVKVSSSAMIQDRTVIFDAKIKKAIAGLMVIQYSRGQNVRDYQEKLLTEFIPEARTQLYKDFSYMDKNDIDEVLNKCANDEKIKKQLFAEAIQYSNINGNIQNAIANRKWTLYRIAAGKGEFITSDNPILFLNDKTGDAKPFENGIDFPEVTVYYTISPKLVIACYHPERLVVENQLVVLNYDKEKEWVRKINRALYVQCSRQCYAHSLESLKDILT